MNLISYASDEPNRPIIWCCGLCGMLYPSGTAARLANLDTDDAKDAAFRSAVRCCQCSEPNCAEQRQVPWVQCAKHQAERAEQAAASRKAAIAAWPVVADTGGPYCDNRDHYAADSASLLEQFDEDDEPVLSPCSERRLACPDLVEHIEEYWGESFDDSEHALLGGRMTAVLATVAQIVDEVAPVVWDPRPERIAVRWSGGDYGWVVAE